MDEKFSCCTFIKNSFEIDVQLELWIRHHSILFDEVVVADTGSTDGTLKLLKKLADEIDNLLVVHKEVVDNGNNKWFRDCKKLAIDNAKYNNIIFLDADEYIHEAFVPRVYEYRRKWASGAKLNGALCYRQFVGNLFTEAQGWNYTWQVRVFRKDIPYKISIDGANFVNEGYMPFDRPQIIVYHYGYVKDKKKQSKKGTVQHLRHKNHKASIIAQEKDIEEYDEYHPISILLDSNPIKQIEGFPKIVAENPEAFYSHEVHKGDDILLEEYLRRHKND